MQATQSQVPVTVLTGFLGAGKTTLLNRILSEQHGHKIAVIENEFGPEGIDNELLVADTNEQIVEMNNGCICCTVRGDLIRIMEGLMKRRGKFDAIIVETTGLADPAPVAQTFFVDEDVKAKTQLDSVTALVDAKHVMARLDDSKEAREQVAFADRIGADVLPDDCGLRVTERDYRPLVAALLRDERRMAEMGRAARAHVLATHGPRSSAPACRTLLRLAEAR